MGTTSSLFDRVDVLLGRGSLLDQISELIEEDKTTARQLSLEAAAVLIAGSARRLSSGVESVDRLLGTFSGSQPMIRMLGDKWLVYVTGLAEINDMATEQVQSVFIRVAQIVVAVVKEQQEEHGLDQAELASLLREERDRVTDLGLLSWGPHPKLTPSIAKRLAFDTSRNVIKHRRPQSSDDPPLDDPSRFDRRRPGWLWWAPAVVFMILVVAWLLSQTM